jgi:hypothetical protein
MGLITQRSTPTKKTSTIEGRTIDALVEDMREINDQVEKTFDSLGYTIEIVNLSSVQLLSLGTSPVELLPAPGVDKYYDIDKIVVEFKHGTTPYTLNGVTLLSFQESGGSKYPTPNSNGDNKGFDAYYLSDDSEGDKISCSLSMSSSFIPVNKNMVIRSEDNIGNTIDMSDGDGTMRITIYYKVLTFSL